ncbi:MAG: hypothetical protein KGL35_09595 [Bradyrhizobium sp.]|nr:hypothetical protein [Bradyrhizobium sp.]
MVAYSYSHTDHIIAQCRDMIAITPSDSTVLQQPNRGVWVGGAGNLFVQTNLNSAAGIVGPIPVIAGHAFPMQNVQKVGASTTATGLWLMI